jgi:hypothetical protein
MGVELYDERKDPQENVNIASDAANAEKVKEMAGVVSAGWKAVKMK